MGNNDHFLDDSRGQYLLPAHVLSSFLQQLQMLPPPKPQPTMPQVHSQTKGHNNANDNPNEVECSVDESNATDAAARKRQNNCELRNDVSSQQQAKRLKSSFDA